MPARTECLMIYVHVHISSYKAKHLAVGLANEAPPCGDALVRWHTHTYTHTHTHLRPKKKMIQKYALCSKAIPHIQVWEKIWRIFVLLSATEPPRFIFIWEIEIVINSQWGNERDAVPVTTVVQNDGYPPYSSSRYAPLTSSSSTSSFAVAESGLPLSPGLSSISLHRNIWKRCSSLGTCLRLCAGVKTAE